MTKITKGTTEWASSNVNIFYGCSRNCGYCYAKGMAIRFKRKTEDTWKEMELNEKAFNKTYGKRKGRIMFPTSHDITPETVDACIMVLGKLLKAGNDVLVTTKPNLICVEKICIAFQAYKDQLQFRFTITSLNDDVLKHWEPGAPGIAERVQALMRAYREGFDTSISIEPCLTPDPRALILNLRNYVTGTIWLGPMNYNGKHDFNSKETLQNWVTWFENDPKVKLKDSVYNKLKIKKKKR